VAITIKSDRLHCALKGVGKKTLRKQSEGNIALSDKNEYDKMILIWCMRAKRSLGEWRLQAKAITCIVS
jgi:hypothetical protein